MKKYFLYLLSILLSVSLNAQTLKWVNGIGGSGFDQGFTVAVDLENNIYQGIHFENTADFDPSSNSSSLSSNGGRDIAVCKYDSRGKFLWAKQIGGTADDFTKAIEVDRNGDVYIIGYFRNTIDFDPSSNSTYNLTSSGGDDMFILKLDSDGSLIWAKKIGGTGSDQAYSIAFDQSNNVLVTGYFTGTVDFNPSTSTSNLVSNGYKDCFVLKLSSTGNFIWAKNIGSSLNNDIGITIISDLDNNVFIAGEYRSTCDFDPSSSNYNVTSNGSSDAFVCKLDSSGTFDWVKTNGGVGRDYARSIFISKSGDLLICGNFENTVDFNPGSSTYSISSNGDTDGYIQKLDQNGKFSWAISIGANSIDGIGALVEDAQYNIISTGRFYKTIDFDPDTGQFNLTATASDAFALKLDSSGAFVWAVQFSGSSNELGNDILVDHEGRVVCSGSYDNNTDFDPTTSNYIVSSNGNRDSYLVKLSPCSELHDTVTITSCGNYYSPSGNYEWTISGNYTDTISSFEGCDSIIYFNLTINSKVFDTLTINTCYSYNSPSGKYTWTQDGSYSDTVSTMFGCDSIFSIDLTIVSNSTSFLNVSACDTFISPSGKSFSSGGLFYDTIPNQNGCDSIITIFLSLKNSSSSTINISSCNSYYDTLSNKLHTASGTFYDTIPNSLGCDSIIRINLNIDSIDVSVTQNGNILVSNQNNASYQWLDCNNSYAQLTNDTNQIIIPTQNGSFAVEVSNMQCTDTSACYNTTVVSIMDQNADDSFTISPNPTKGYILFKNIDKKLNSVSIFSIEGKLVKRISNLKESIDISDLQKGIYFLQFQGNGQHSMKKVILN